MNAYNPLAATKRLEAAGLGRAQAEAIASEIDEGTKEIVTRPMLKAELDEAIERAIDKAVIKFGAMTAAIVGVATAILGVLIAIR